MKCDGCFARNVMGENNLNINLKEYKNVVLNFIKKGGKQINLLGGEPYLHPNLLDILSLNKEYNIKTTIYTNGYYLGKYTEEQLNGIKNRVSIYSENKKIKNFKNITCKKVPFDANFMISKETVVNELLEITKYIEEGNYKCKTFFISSIRELDNPRQEFFDDTDITMPILKYKELVHEFLNKYDGNMDIHVSKRGVFESTVSRCNNKCRFANYFIGGKIIQCPYDVVNLKYQNDYEFNERFCQQNNTCLMSKVIYRKK